MLVTDNKQDSRSSGIPTLEYFRVLLQETRGGRLHLLVCALVRYALYLNSKQHLVIRGTSPSQSKALLLRAEEKSHLALSA